LAPPFLSGEGQVIPKNLLALLGCLEQVLASRFAVDQIMCGTDERQQQNAACMKLSVATL
jgi:hypothetical protein